MNLYRKIVPENLRVSIRNIQYYVYQVIYIIRRLSKKQNLLPDNTTKKKLLVAYIIPTSKITGGVAVACEHVNRLKKRGYNTLLISCDNKTNISWFPNQETKIITLKKSKEYIERNVTHLVATGWITAYEADLLNIPNKYYFVQSDERRFYPDKSYLRKRVAYTYKLPFRFLTGASWLSEWLKIEFNQPSTYIPNGLNKEIFHPVKPLVPKPKNKPRILLEGAINLPFKNMAEAFEVASGLDAEIWCVSNDGKPKTGWRCDRFFENVPIYDMKKIYSSCDFLLKLSTVEGAFCPPLEMIACGGIPIVRDVTGADQTLKDGYNSYFLKGRSVQEMRREIETLIKNKKFIERLKMNQNATIETHNWETSIDLLTLIYS